MKVRIDTDEDYPVYSIDLDINSEWSTDAMVELTEEEIKMVRNAFEVYRVAQDFLGEKLETNFKRQGESE